MRANNPELCVCLIYTADEVPTSTASFLVGPLSLDLGCQSGGQRGADQCYS